MKNAIQFLVTITWIMFASSNSFASATVEQSTCVGEEITLKVDPSLAIGLTLVVSDIRDPHAGIHSRLVTATFAGKNYEGLAIPSSLGEYVVLSNREDSTAPALFKGYLRKTWGLGASVELSGELTIAEVRETHELSDYDLSCDR